MKTLLSKIKNIRTVRRADKRKVRKFLGIAGSITLAYLIVATVVTFTLLAQHGSNRNPGDYDTTVVTPPAIDIIVDPPDDPGDEAPRPAPPPGTNVLVLGLDALVGLADTIILANISWETGAVGLLSIPRDTYTVVPPARLQRMRDLGLRPPNHGTMRINALRSYGRQYGVYFTKEQLGEMLGIHIDYYVEIRLSAFRELVDMVGGVEIEVPIRMLYSDPGQNLHIDIQPGVHLLDGNMAEQVVRFRGYGAADLARINVQQQVMTQLFRQVLRRDTIMQNAVDLARVGLTHVNTNAGILNMLNYAQHIGNFSPENIHTAMLPGNARRIHGVEYFVPDPAQVPEVVGAIFHGAAWPQRFQRPEVQTSLDARIAVFNGTRISGLAMSLADVLEMDGYNVVDVRHFLGQQENRTRIQVRAADFEAGLGEDLVSYFRNAAVLVNEDIPDGFDIVIIVGRSEEN